MNDPSNLNSTLPTEQAAKEEGSFWKDLRGSIMGTQQDFTEGSLGRAITLLAIPMVLEMGMQSLFGVVDVFFVGRLGADAVAVVGITESLLTVVFAIGIGLSMSSAAMVARRIGEKDPVAAAVSAVQSIAAALALSVVLGIAGFVFAHNLFELMGASPAISSAGRRYGQIMLGGNLTIVVLFVINAIFRGAGDAVFAMRALWIANSVNILLDPCFIFGLGPFPKLGVTGAAVSTTIGRGIGVFYQLTVLLRGQGRLKIHLHQLRIDSEIMLRLIRISLGGIFQFLIATASWLGLMRIVASFGSAALAGYTIALRIIVFAILPSWGMSNAAATLVGQNLGARKIARAERSVWMTGFYNMLFLVCVAIVFIIFAEPLIRIFTHDPAVVSIGVDCLRFVSYGYGFYAYGLVMEQAFNGAGDTYTPTVINLFCYWMLEIPLAYVLAFGARLGTRGVFLAITIAESITAVVGVLVFRRGRWKTRKV